MDAEDSLIAKMWMAAARARPQDVELQENWMMSNFDAGNWKQAQSVCFRLLADETSSPYAGVLLCANSAHRLP